MHRWAGRAALGVVVALLVVLSGGCGDDDEAAVDDEVRTWAQEALDVVDLEAISLAVQEPVDEAEAEACLVDAVVAEPRILDVDPVTLLLDPASFGAETTDAVAGPGPASEREAMAFAAVLGCSHPEAITTYFLEVLAFPPDMASAEACFRAQIATVPVEAQRKAVEDAAQEDITGTANLVMPCLLEDLLADLAADGMSPEDLRCIERQLDSLSPAELLGRLLSEDPAAIDGLVGFCFPA